MESIVGKVLLKRGNVLGTIKINDRPMMSIVSKNQSIYGLLNGYKVIESNSCNNFIADSNPLFSRIALRVCKSKENLADRLYIISNSMNKPKYKDLMENFIKEVSTNPEEISVQLLQSTPDEDSENKPQAPDIKSANVGMVNNLKNYNLLLTNCKETIDRVMSLSSAIMRTKLSKNMWGTKEIQKILDDSKRKLATLSQETENFESAVESTDRNMSPFINILSRADVTAKKNAVADFSRNFYFVKKLMVDLASSAFNLYTIDSSFRKHTGFPTTWFFNSSLFYDFLYYFENLMDHIIDLIKAESNVVEPLTNL